MTVDLRHENIADVTTGIPPISQRFAVAGPGVVPEEVLNPQNPIIVAQNAKREIQTKPAEPHERVDLETPKTAGTKMEPDSLGFSSLCGAVEEIRETLSGPSQDQPLQVAALEKTPDAPAPSPAPAWTPQTPGMNHGA